ncbi:DUF11 domain-containing protein [Microbacterium sp. Marseille-Q6965]|uniref:DUF11 domain-containing protein n=1 Tax=Microbacterium sp. Marseille-Q6965 TaxID=2965072 RepID=UPI0021B7A179|nr:DUF11 domain-containing protein [Microbacterium sp. Marseille-Q6965]
MLKIGVVAAVTALTTTLMPAVAYAAPVSVHEITARWAGNPVPTAAPFGQPVTAEWRVNTNDADDPYSNEPVDNVRVTLTAGNGVFTSIPTICKTRDVTPVSEISADGTTLLCNLGTVREGTATVIQTPLRASSTTGGDLTVSGTATSDSAAAESAPADPGPLPITYTYGMDLSLVSAPGQAYQGGVKPSRSGGDRTFLQMNFSLILAAGSRPGPSTYSFPVTVGANFTGALNGLQWEGCVPVGDGSAATGQPFSDPAKADRTNFPTCAVSGSGTSYTVTLSNLDYTLVNTPTRDSLGQPLPGNGAYIASGTVQFSIPSPVTQITNFSFTAAPGAFTFSDGTARPDGDAANNSSNTTLVPPGSFSNLWAGSPANSRASWDTNLWVSPGTGADITLPQPGIDDIDDYNRAVADRTISGLPLYMQANSGMWNGYQGPAGAELAGVCTMNQNPAFVPTWVDGGGWDSQYYLTYTTARFFYTTAAIDTRTETCGDAAPSAKWVEVFPPAGHELTDPRIGTDILMQLPPGVTGVKMTWDPAVDRPRDAQGYTFLRVLGPIDENAPTSGEGWTVGAFNSPADAAATWPTYPTLNDWVNLSTMPGGTMLPGSEWNMNGHRDAFRLQGPQGLIEKTVSDTTAQPGVPVTYSLRAQAQNLVTSPPPVSFEVVDTLPQGMVYVAGSGRPAPSSVSADGRTLTWSFTNVEANVFQDITYQAQRPVDSVIAPGTNLTNTAVINVPGDNRPANTPGRTATATVTVPSASATVFGKSSVDNVLAFEGDSSAWVLTINSQDPVASAFTDTIDILPAVGDGRGTNIDGTYTVTGVDAPAGSRVLYTDAPLSELSTDPRDPSNGGTPGSEAGNTVGWQAEAIDRPTAIRVIGPELAPGATQTIRIAYETPAGSSCVEPAAGDNKPGQILVNSAGSWAEHSALPMLSSSVTEIANCYAVDLKKYVQDADGEWHDANTLADYPTFRVGDEVTYRIVVENIGQGTITDLEITDDLFPEGSFTVDELARGEEDVHEYTVTMTGGGAVVNNACGTAATPPDAEAPTILCDPAGVQVVNYTTAKSSNPASGETVRPGDTITYTIAVTQEGTVPANAEFTDTLVDLVDDAVYNGDLSASIGTATLDGDVISWSGTVPVGEVALITYSVTLKDSAGLEADGDYLLGNTVTSPGCVDACSTEHPVADYRVAKTSDPADGSNVETGETIQYTVTVTQLGEAAFEGASLSDDLSDVLDDATWNDDLLASAGTVGFDETAQTLSWSGDLAVDDVVTITYSVTVTGDGDTRLHNVVSSEGCVSPEECETEHFTATYTTVKTADPASGTAVQIGDVITYTITVTQSGQGRVVGQFFDDNLADVLDDATFNNDITASAGTFTYVDGVISWTGDLGPGDVATVTYSVTVTADGDTRIGNTVRSPGCESAADCETEHLTGRYDTVKTSDPQAGSDVQIGDTIEYTVTVSQVGEAAVEGASFADDLSAVLDDATWNGDLDASAGTVDYAEPAITWSGDLAVDDVVTVTYSVTVTGAGDMVLTNVVTSDGCVDAADCTTTHQTGAYTVSKTADPAPGSDVAVGDAITYTVTVAQRGPGAVTGASFDDDLSDVLDDATWDDTLTATIGTASFEEDSAELAWSGDLAVGAVATITYTVTLTGEGDMTLTNVATPGENGECVPAGDGNADCTTTHQTGRFTYAKMADPIHNSDVQAGDVVTYTVTVTQAGPAGVAASVVDDLSDVLDDATYNGDVAATGGTASVDGATLSWAGDMAPGDEVTITYSVTVTGEGNTTLANVVTSTSPAGECVTAADGTEQCRTVHKTGGYVFAKTADPASGTQVNKGDTVTYTLTVTQRGQGAIADAVVTDDVAGVLSASSWNDDATATAGEVTRDGNTLTWTGDLGVGQTATITYSVTVTSDGPAQLVNVVSSPDERAICDPTGVCTTEHEVPAPEAATPPLTATGGTIAWGAAGLAGLLLLAGVLVLATQRRRREHTTETAD